MHFVTTLVLIFCSVFVSNAQHGQEEKLVKYSTDFKFKEGIYLNFEQVKSNKPLPKSRIISSEDYSNPDFLDNLLEKEVLFYYDGLGNKKELKVKNIWGYSRNGFIYVNLPDGFFRITQIGRISHFVASRTVYSSAYNSPYHYNYYNEPYGYSRNRQETEVRQFLLDFDHGRVLDYTDESMSILLMPDPELHDEYSSLRKKKRKQMRFMYLRKFNERNPLYFPQN